MNYRTAAEKLSSKLGLENPVIALSFVESSPPGVETFEDDVPSACTLWRKAESRVFYAPAVTHFNCPVGAITMGFELPAEVGQQLMGLVEKMCGCEYLSPEEASEIPSVSKQKAGIVYGPLADFPVEPDLILMWLKPSQAMYFNEATGSAAWTSSPLPVLGRPACAALPMAFGEGKSALSLGCMGMRTFTEVSEDRLLAALPASNLEELMSHLDATMTANAEMATFYQQHKAAYAK